MGAGRFPVRGGLTFAMARRTYLERLFPMPPIFQDLAQEWCADQSTLLLKIVWDAYDRLKLEHFDRVPPALDDERKEESFNALLAVTMTRCKSAFAPFDILHEFPEQTSRMGGRANSPHPDIAFSFHNNPRSVWPLEGKVLYSEDDIDAYCAEVAENFLTGRYATFSSEGAMLGYLLGGKADDALKNIARLLQCRLFKHKSFMRHPHRVSSHQRKKLPTSASPLRFQCHHLILVIQATPFA